MRRSLIPFLAVALAGTACMDSGTGPTTSAQVDVTTTMAATTTLPR